MSDDLEFCGICHEVFRSFVREVFEKGFTSGLTEGRRQRFITDSAGVLVDAFIKDECVLELGGKTQANPLFQSFSIWHSRTFGGAEVLTSTWFGRRISGRFSKVKLNGLLYYRGVVLKTGVPTAVRADDNHAPIVENAAGTPDLGRTDNLADAPQEMLPLPFLETSAALAEIPPARVAD